ncbi:MAG: hypothetical protein PUC88_06645 [Clostridia bacterium]|nr:hypothetical protein [Clostridia bacterium]
MYSRDEERKTTNSLQKVSDAEQRLDNARDKNIDIWTDPIIFDVIFSLSGDLRGAKE